MPPKIITHNPQPTTYYLLLHKMTVVYDAILVHDTDSQGYFCDFPYPVEQLFGKKRVKIKALIDNTVLYRGTLTPMCGIYRVMLNKQIREHVGKQAGDTVHIEV